LCVILLILEIALFARQNANMKIDLNIPTGAIFSEDHLYRYALWRVWKPTRPIFLQISLNPSKADHRRNDPTVTRGLVRADRCGFGTFFMANLYAYVSTDPKKLLELGPIAVGLETDAYLRLMIDMVMQNPNGRVLCAWGSFPPVKKRAPAVLAMIPAPYCLGVNADGQPKHPLYVRYDVEMVPLPVLASK